jgi:hypothetical protein
MNDVSYRGLGFTDYQPPVNAEVLAQFENKIGARCPEDYRQFLLTLDGGSTEPKKGTSLSIRGKAPRSREILEFFCVKDRIGHTIDNALDGYDFNVRVPNLIIPIGRFIGDYMPCISLRTKDYGHIYVWGPMSLWEDEAEEYEQSEDDLFFLANSFNEFLDMLKPLPED